MTAVRPHAFLPAGATQRGVRLFIGVVVVLAAACREQRRGAPPPVPVTVAPVERHALPFEIVAPGTVEPIRAVQVAAQVSGILTSVRFREGQDVEEGQILATIDPRPYRNALRQAEAALARDVVQLENARRQAERYQSLAKSEYVTDEQYQALRTAAEALAAAVKSDSAALDNARLNLEYTTIRAPISGRAGSLLIREGNLVRAPGSGPLVLLNQTRPLQVRFAVPASFLPEIRHRAADSLQVRVRPTNDSASALEGMLAFVDNAVDTTTGTIMLKGRFDNTDGVLWPGQFVTATLQLYVEDALVVPQPAVMLGEGSSYVFVVGPDQKASTRRIEVGRQVGDLVIVTRGLDIGESVVTDGQLRVTPGAQVEIRSDSMPAGDRPDSVRDGPSRGDGPPRGSGPGRRETTS
ncbi:MAG: efflux RND transporter periplasmic adaptor subunit [Gemmatimonadetes bacterium]|nr:efflux RND transporter periplasmic adaptor subunit [Gemmatimonadota bacterium]